MNSDAGGWRDERLRDGSGSVFCEASAATCSMLISKCYAIHKVIGNGGDSQTYLFLIALMQRELARRRIRASIPAVVN